MLCHKITPPEHLDIDAIVLHQYLNREYGDKKFTLCQIGANDGISADPIFYFIKRHVYNMIITF